MAWSELQDPDNPENRNAGNGGDLVKHTVYLTVLRALLAHEPWRSGMVLRECHAGRGMYRVEGERAALVEELMRHDLLLSRAQRKAEAHDGWYAGSAVLLNHASEHRYEGYEWDPATRRILYAVLPHATLLGDNETHFDGESHIAEHITQWSSRDVVLLDPFGLWRHDKHAFRRARYRRILSAWSEHDEAPVLLLFWTWGRSSDDASVENGYHALSALVPRRVVIRWRWDLSYAMWVLCPDALTGEIQTELERECRALFDALAPRDARLSISVES